MVDLSFSNTTCVPGTSTIVVKVNSTVQSMMGVIQLGDIAIISPSVFIGSVDTFLFEVQIEWFRCTAWIVGFSYSSRFSLVPVRNNY